MERSRISKFRVFQWVLLALTLAFIWGHSCMPVEDSAAESGFVMELIRPFLEIFVGRGNVTDHLVRKIAHFVEFAALGAQFELLRRGLNVKGAPRSLGPGFLCAFLDESIQLLSDRGAMIIDVWLDSCGVLFGILAAFALRKAARALRRKERA